MTAPELEICGKCMGSGYGGHPDSGVLCPDCGGTGGVYSLAPEVAALIAEARREGWNAAIEAANWLGLTFYDKVPKGSLTSVTILEYREAIRALKETTHD